MEQETHSKKKRRTLRPEEFARAAELETLLFGAPTTRDEPEVGGGSLAAALFAFEDRSGRPPAGAGEQQDAEPAPRQAAWEDEDDVRVKVDVAGAARLRKLRQAEEEVVLSGAQYEQRLRAQHAKLNPRAAWAALDSKKKQKQKKRGSAAAAEERRLGGASSDEEAEEDASGLLRRAGGLLAEDEGTVLPRGLLETTRLRDANQEEPCQSVVRSLEFHANGQLLMTAGLDKRLRFFNVDGVKNPKVQSVFLEDMPVHQAAFAGGGSQVIAAGRRKFFYVFDLPAARVERVAGLFGREERSLESFAASQSSDQAAFFCAGGHVALVSLRSRQAAGSLQMAGSARTGAFSADGRRLLTAGGDGMVYVWDLRMRRCLGRAADEGSLGGTALACSPAGLVAAGSSSGVVNIYDPATFGLGAGSSSSTSIGAGASLWGAGAAPTAAVTARPAKTLLNLTTSVDTLAFNHDGQILALASRMKRDALRLLHVPSMTVFSNWPTSKSPLHYVHSVAFSPSSGYLAIGNARGRALLYRLHAYPAV